MDLDLIQESSSQVKRLLHTLNASDSAGFTIVPPIPSLKCESLIAYAIENATADLEDQIIEIREEKLIEVIGSAAYT